MSSWLVRPGKGNDNKKEQIKDSAAVGSLILTLTVDGGQAHLKGVFNEHEIEAVTQRENPSDFTLMNRGFQWISEEPYFRWLLFGNKANLVSERFSVS